MSLLHDPVIVFSIPVMNAFVHSGRGPPTHSPSAQRMSYVHAWSSEFARVSRRWPCIESRRLFRGVGIRYLNEARVLDEKTVGISSKE